MQPESARPCFPEHCFPGNFLSQLCFPVPCLPKVVFSWLRFPKHDIGHGSGAQLHVAFCGKSETFTPVYDPDPPLNTASVNAGDYCLYVSGGSINLAFMRALALPNNGDPEAKKDTTVNHYMPLHEAMFHAALEKPGKLVPLSKAGENAASCAKKLRLMGSFARLPLKGTLPGVPQESPSPVGITIVDVFGAKSRPLHEKNVAMVYTVGPKGKGAHVGHGDFIEKPADFLNSVEGMASNMLMAVCEYNQIAATEDGTARLPQIEVMQVCLVSGGVYMHEAFRRKKVHVAFAIIKGFQSAANSVFEKLPLLRFCWDDDAFGHAAQNVLGLSVPSTLNSFMLAHAQNKHSALPSGYNIPSLSVVRHEATGITVQCPPIVVSPVGEDSIVIYHYCHPPTSNGRYDYLRPSCGHYGEGVYATRKAPDNFSSKDDILLNNFTNKIDPDEQERQIKMRRIQGDADYCVPLVVPRSLAIDVRHQKSSEMKQPGQDIHGRPIRNGRDIWLVVIRDQNNKVQPVGDLQKHNNIPH